MKIILTATIAFVMVIFFSFTSKSFANGNDTLIVYANGLSLDQIVNNDIASSQAHSVYKLVSLDTTYLYLGSINVKSNITVTGVLGSNGRPPCIQPGILSDGSVPATLFSMASKGTSCNFENLYIVELSTIGSWTGGTTFNVAADSVRLYLNNVIDEENHYVIIWYSGIGDKIFITNCKIRNAVNPTDWYAPQLVSPNGYLPVYPLDTLVMDYNTFFCTNGGAGGSTFTKHLEFVHNSVVYTFFTAMLPPPGNVGSAKIDNNIFYSVMSGGNSKSEFTWMDDPFQPEVSSVIVYDTLSAVSDTVFDPSDVGNANLRMLAEAKRKVEVENNIYFMPKPVTDFQTAWNDTAHVDSLYTPGWMNDRTTHMFNDKTTWPGFVESGNIVSTDPAFGSSFVNVLNGGTGYGVGLLDYISLVRSGTVTTEEWGYQKQSVTGSNWIPQWPLPEQTSGALRYSTNLAQPDGKPYGDPYWFTLTPTGIKQQSNNIPNSFSLSQNYPNPFNPTTVIKYSLPNSSNVSLKVFNMLGQEVANLVNQQQQAGNYSVNFDATRLASGVYMYSIQAGGFSLTKKMMLLK